MTRHQRSEVDVSAAGNSNQKSQLWDTSSFSLHVYGRPLATVSGCPPRAWTGTIWRLLKAYVSASPCMSSVSISPSAIRTWTVLSLLTTGACLALPPPLVNLEHRLPSPLFPSPRTSARAAIDHNTTASLLAQVPMLFHSFFPHC